jgi:hypothetical protein
MPLRGFLKTPFPLFFLFHVLDTPPQDNSLPLLAFEEAFRVYPLCFL